MWLGPLAGSTLYRRDYALFYPAAYWSFCLLMITADIFYKHYRIRQEQSEKEMEREVRATICEARQLMVSSVAAISQMIDEKDRYTSEHSHRVAEYARLIGAHMGFAGEELDSLYRSALLHDIGKIAVPDAILNKPSRLTDEEFDIMKQHTVWGRKILEGLEFLPQADCGASYHHERFDGKGYPAGLKGGQLPEMVWIISVADALGNDGILHIGGAVIDCYIAKSLQSTPAQVARIFSIAVQNNNFHSLTPYTVSGKRQISRNLFAVIPIYIIAYIIDLQASTMASTVILFFASRR